MKVFFCETYDDGTVGGSHACMYNLIKHIDRSKIEFVAGFYGVNSYVPRYRDLGVDVKILPFNNPLRSGNVILRKALNWYRLEYKAQHYLENYLRQEGFDLVVLNNSVFSSLLFVRACKRLCLPLIVYERGIGYFEKRHIRATSKIAASIPISDAVCQFLLDNNFRTRIIERIYDGLDLEEFRAQVKRSPEEIKKDLGIPQASRVIGIIGNVRPWKGQRYFLDAFISLARHYDDIYGLVVGGWATEEDSDFQAGLKEQVRNAGLEGRLLFLGYRNDVSELLTIFDVFVHASRKAEPFGMVILEAMAAKKPVIATNLGGPMEILGNGEYGILIPPKDGEAIAEACIRYLDDPVFRQKMVEKAYQRVIENFKINKTVERSIDLFTRVVESPKSSR